MPDELDSTPTKVTCTASHRPERAFLTPGVYRVNLRDYYHEDRWPAEHHPALDIAICGLTELSYQTPQGVEWHVETGIPGDSFRVWAQSTNDAIPEVEAYFEVEGSNVYIWVKHGTNSWAFETQKTDKPNKQLNPTNQGAP